MITQPWTADEPGAALASYFEPDPSMYSSAFSPPEELLDQVRSGFDLLGDQGSANGR
jgi:hypothetical protein